MHTNVIFCFSGTGNCLDLAKNIARGIGGADIVMMRSAPAVTDVREASRVGFVFPCHAGGAPAGMLEQVKAIRVSPEAYTFGVSCSASYPGTGLYELDRIIPLRYWRTVTHQCSCIWLFPHTLMLPRMSAEEAQARSERLAADIAHDIWMGTLTGKKPPRNFLNAAESLGWNSFVLRKKAAGFAVSGACVGCGQCVRLCPRGNIRLEDGKAVIGTNCIQCLSCLQYCPEQAISLGAVTDRREHYRNPNVTPEELTKAIITVESK